MFGFIADILTSVTSILFPVFASYKALRTSDPAVLTPWLMYWTTLSLLLLVEAQFNFILSWIPFYSWMRFGVHLYLVLPGKQGSVYIYKEYIHPFLEEHERQIDRFISEGHAKGKAAGMDAIKRAIDYIRVQFLGQAPRQPSPQPSRNVSYSTHLMSRFAMPSAREGLATAGTSDLFSLLGKAMQQTTYPDASSRDERAADLAASGSLIPPSLSGAEREDFVNTQRDRLRTLLQAFDATSASPSNTTGADPSRSRQATSRKSYIATSASRDNSPPTPPSRSQQHLGGGYPIHPSRSESEFEDVGYETMPDPEHFRAPRDGYRERGERPPTSGSAKGKDGRNGWSNFIWGSYGQKDSALDMPRKEL